MHSPILAIFSAIRYGVSKAAPRAWWGPQPVTEMGGPAIFQRHRASAVSALILASSAALLTPGATAAATAASTHCGWSVPTEFGPNASLSAISVTSDGTGFGVGTAGWDAFAEEFSGSIWRTERIGHIGGALTGVDAVANDDVWAVGKGADSSLVEHYNGSSWHKTVLKADKLGLKAIGGSADGELFAVGNSPAGKALGSGFRYTGSSWSTEPLARTSSAHGTVTLSTISYVSPTDIWVGGSYIAETGHVAPLIEHFDGARWEMVRLPRAANHRRLRVHSISALMDGEVWAVADNGAKEPTIFHYDGSHWSLSSPPVVSGENAVLDGVSADASNDVWVVGTLNSSHTTLSLHFNGSGWTLVPSPDGGRGTGSLTSVEAISSSTAWAVGATSIVSPSPLALSWNGEHWLAVQSRPTDDSSKFSSVESTLPDDVWMVGTSNSVRGHQQALARHWDGAAWSEPPVPHGHAYFSYLRGVASSGPDDVWAVGEKYGANGQSALIEHFDGSTWHWSGGPKKVNTPSLLGVGVVSSSSVWAAGSASSGDKTVGIVERFNGKRWSMARLPKLRQSTSLASIDPISADNVWAVGVVGNRSLAVHYDGSTWSTVGLPLAKGAVLKSVVGSASDLWITGRSAQAPAGLVLRYNGTKWRVVHGLPAQSKSVSIAGLYAVSPNDVWAVGVDGRDEVRGIVEHFDGAHWTVVSNPASRKDGSLSGVAFSSSGEGWAVGRQGPAGLTEHFQAQRCS
jgi:hypothetical protein